MRKNIFSFILFLLLNIIAFTHLSGAPGNYIENVPSFIDPMMENFKNHIINRDNCFIIQGQDKSNDLEFLRHAATYLEILNDEQYMKLEMFYSRLKQNLQERLISLLPDPNKWNIFMTGTASLAGLGMGGASALSGNVVSSLGIIFTSLGIGKIFWNDYKNAKGSLKLFDTFLPSYSLINHKIRELSQPILKGKIHEIALGTTIGFRQRITDCFLEEFEEAISKLTTFLLRQFNRDFQEEYNFSLTILDSLKFR